MSETPLAPRWNGRRVAITGGAGFIGATVGRQLADAGAQVVVFDNFNPLGGANRFNLEGYESRLRVIEGDVRDAAAIAALVEGQDVLFNLAAQTSHKDSMDDPHTDLEINALAQLNIVQACRKAAPDIRIVYASTRQLYGKADYLPVDEKHALRPPDVNGVNKLAGENYHLLYDRVYGLKANVARLTNTYGPRMRVADARQMFLGAWIGAALSGASFEVWGGEQKRDLSFVSDAAAALIALADIAPSGQVFNIGGATPISLLELADMVVELSGGPAYVRKEFPAERRAIDIGDYYADDTALRRAAGWAPCTEVRDGLAQTIAFYRDNLARYR